MFILSSSTSISFQDFIPEVLETISRGRMRLNQPVIVPNVENPAECIVQAEIVDKTTPQGQANAIYRLAVLFGPLLCFETQEFDSFKCV